MFELLKIEKVKTKETDTAIKSSSSNGLVKTRLPYTKIRKQFDITVTKVSTKEEVDELNDLFNGVRTINPFIFNHPDEKDSFGNPKQYNVRFRENIEIERDANFAGFYIVSPFTLEEV